MYSSENKWKMVTLSHWFYFCRRLSAGPATKTVVSVRQFAWFQLQPASSVWARFWPQLQALPIHAALLKAVVHWEGPWPAGLPNSTLPLGRWYQLWQQQSLLPRRMQWQEQHHTRQGNRKKALPILSILLQIEIFNWDCFSFVPGGWAVGEVECIWRLFTELWWRGSAGQERVWQPCPWEWRQILLRASHQISLL